MSDERRKVRHILNSITAGPDRYALVECDDGSYGITSNGQLIESLTWNSNQLEQCRAFLRHFTQKDPMEALKSNRVRHLSPIHQPT